MRESTGGGFWEKLPFPTKLLEEIVSLAPLKILVSRGDARANHSPLSTSLRRWQPQRHTEKRRREPRPVTMLGFRLNQHEVSSTLGFLLQEIRLPLPVSRFGMVFSSLQFALAINCYRTNYLKPSRLQTVSTSYPSASGGLESGHSLAGCPPSRSLRLSSRCHVRLWSPLGALPRVDVLPGHSSGR